jgi:hypothetical protein
MSEHDPQTIEIQRMHMAYDIANTQQGPAADLAAKFLEQQLAGWVTPESSGCGRTPPLQEIQQRAERLMARAEALAARNEAATVIDLGPDYTVSVETDDERALMFHVYHSENGTVRRQLTDGEYIAQLDANSVGASHKPEVAAKLLGRWLCKRGIKFAGIRSPVKLSDRKVLDGTWRRRLFVVVDDAAATGSNAQIPAIFAGYQIELLQASTDIDLRTEV